jgi:SET domain-containing protein
VQKCVDAEVLRFSNWTRYLNSVRRGDGRIQNATFKIVGNRIGVQAVRDIRKGQEIFVD